MKNIKIHEKYDRKNDIRIYEDMIEGYNKDIEVAGLDFNKVDKIQEKKQLIERSLKKIKEI